MRAFCGGPGGLTIGSEDHGPERRTCRCRLFGLGERRLRLEPWMVDGRPRQPARRRRYEKVGLGFQLETWPCFPPKFAELFGGVEQAESHCS